MVAANKRDFQEKKLFFLRWLLINKPNFARALTVFLFIVCAVFWIWALINLGSWLFNLKRDQQNITSLAANQIDFAAWKQKNTPQALIIGATNFVTTDQESYDLTAVVTNPNANWYITSLEYQFVWETGASRGATTYFLPQEKKHLLLLGEKIKNFTGSAQLKIINTTWKRTTATDNFPVVNDADFSLTTPVYTAPANGEIVTMSFEITNDSVFSFWEAPVNVVLSRGGTVIGLQNFVLNKFLTGQTRKIEINWPGDLATPDQTDLELDINFFDRSVYIPF